MNSRYATMATQVTFRLPNDELQKLKGQARLEAARLGIDVDYIDIIRMALCKTYGFTAKTKTVAAMLNNRPTNMAEYGKQIQQTNQAKLDKLHAENRQRKAEQANSITAQLWKNQNKGGK